ncbi:MAG: hypothetical protein J2P56_01200 [Verrucomicrobia bacterium]|nr:hypothetical protein [Verrucomicrobiota bacterium]
MTAVIGVMMKQLVEVRGSSEDDDNQEVRDQNANDCLLPTLNVANSRHPLVFKALHGVWQRMPRNS